MLDKYKMHPRVLAQTVKTNITYLAKVLKFVVVTVVMVVVVVVVVVVGS